MSKLGKFRRGPRVFFSDAKNPWVRKLGQVATPLLEKPKLRKALLDPLTALQALPLMAPVVGSLRQVARGRRQRMLADAGNPKVTVIMAAWNASKTIDAAIDSMRAQSYANFELLVVDDGSEDDTVKRVSHASAQDSRIRLLASDENAGAAHARNLGLQASSGDFITFHDSDDRSHSERIERQLAALVSDPLKMFCLCNYSRVDDTGRVLEVNGREVSKSVISMMFRREVFARQGYFMPLRISEDAEYYSRMKSIFGAAAEVTLFPVLYLQGFSSGSLLFSDGDTQRHGESVVHKRSIEAEEQLRKIELQHQEIRAGLDVGYVAFSRARVPFR